MKDYSHLKGKEVKFTNHFQGLKFNNCYVAEIDDCGLTILGFCTGLNDGQIKIFCLRNEVDAHLEKFPMAVEMIIKGTIDLKKIRAQGYPRGGQPSCAFE